MPDIENWLTSNNLLVLREWALARYAEGWTFDRIQLEVRKQPEYKARFPYMEDLARAGRAISEAEAIQLERSYSQINRAAGLPTQFYDSPEDFAELIKNEVSPSEWGQRVNEGLVAAQAAPQEVRDDLRNLYGAGAGELAAFFLDPDRAMPVIERQFTAAQISGAGRRTGYGGLSQTEAESLGSLGVTTLQAEKGFGELSRSKELFNALPGEGGEEITREEQFAAAFGGSAEQQERLRKRAAQRSAAFQGGGGVASGREGLAGLGEARG